MWTRRPHPRLPSRRRRRRSKRPFPICLMPVDVLEDDDRVVDDHADREGQTREADDVEVAIHRLEPEEGSDHAGRDRDSAMTKVLRALRRKSSSTHIARRPPTQRFWVTRPIALYTYSVSS